MQNIFSPLRLLRSLDSLFPTRHVPCGIIWGLLSERLEPSGPGMGFWTVLCTVPPRPWQRRGSEGSGIIMLGALSARDTAVRKHFLWLRKAMSKTLPAIIKR